MILASSALSMSARSYQINSRSAVDLALLVQRQRLLLLLLARFARGLAVFTGFARLTALSGYRTVAATMGCTVKQSLHGQLDAALFIRLQHLDLDDLALGQVIGDLLHALMGDLADVQQAVLAGQQVDEGAEVQNLRDRAFVHLADFHFGRDLLDAALGFIGLG